MVIVSRTYTLLIVAFIIFICSAYLDIAPVSLRESIDAHYLHQLRLFKTNLVAFKKLVEKKASLDVLKKQFFQSRLIYKKVAIITEYFNIYETKLLNGPAISRIEDDNPGNIIKPAGLQTIEQELFSNWNVKSYKVVSTLLSDMLTAVARLENEPDRKNKFKNELVWDALRSATIRITAMGITGFDSPIAQYSLPEARSSLEEIVEILTIVNTEVAPKDDTTFKTMMALVYAAESKLTMHASFNHFDRLAFIVNYLNPFYTALLKARKQIGIAAPAGNSPINYDAPSIFSLSAFNINFYTPGERYAISPERIELGKKLFSDSLLSGNNTRSCASCHAPDKAFTDGFKTPLALDGETRLARNTPTLWNSALQTKQFLDSRTDILENQLDEVVHNQKEMKGSLKNNVSRLKNSPTYNKLFREAYQNIEDPISPFTIANAISSYLRSLISLNSRFDQYVNGDTNKLTIAEKNGFNLFTGKAKCATCHFIPLFNGLVPPVFTETESEILGVPETKSTKPAVLDPDLGKYTFTKSIIHKYAFKTPTLRNIELTAPYMHNGVFTTLEEVINFYNNGGGKGLNIAPENQSLSFDKLHLSKKEVSEIISFMKSLTDTGQYTSSATSHNKKNPLP